MRVAKQLAPVDVDQPGDKDSLGVDAGKSACRNDTHRAARNPYRHEPNNRAMTLSDGWFGDVDDPRMRSPMIGAADY
jgi:hypothetical protein